MELAGGVCVFHVFPFVVVAGTRLAIFTTFFKKISKIFQKSGIFFIRLTAELKSLYERVKIIAFAISEDYRYAVSENYASRKLSLRFNSVILNDKTWKVFYNVDAFDKEKDPEKKAILEYFSNGEAKSDFTSKVDEEVIRNRGKREYRRHFMTWEQEIKIYGEKVAIDVRNEMQPIIDQQAARIAELEAQLAELQKSSASTR